jgi:hypothetical protein
VANTLQQAGLVRYCRGHIRVRNLDGLRENACECYETVRALSDRLIGPWVVKSIPQDASVRRSVRGERAQKGAVRGSKKKKPTRSRKAV